MQIIAVLIIFSCITLSIIYNNPVKRIISLNIALSILIFLFSNYNKDNILKQTSPFIRSQEAESLSKIIDPTPQALTLTAIVVGSINTLIAFSIILKIKKYQGNLEF